MNDFSSLPKCPQASPYPLEIKEGERYCWCTCGLSSKQPLCDGTHKGSGFKSQPFIAESTKTVYLCGCKRTKNPPYCDGSHNADL